MNLMFHDITLMLSKIRTCLRLSACHSLLHAGTIKPKPRSTLLRFKGGTADRRPTCCIYSRLSLAMQIGESKLQKDINTLTNTKKDCCPIHSRRQDAHIQTLVIYEPQYLLMLNIPFPSISHRKTYSQGQVGLRGSYLFPFQDTCNSRQIYHILMALNDVEQEKQLQNGLVHLHICTYENILFKTREFLAHPG